MERKQLQNEEKVKRVQNILDNIDDYAEKIGQKKDKSKALLGGMQAQADQMRQADEKALEDLEQSQNKPPEELFKEGKAENDFGKIALARDKYIKEFTEGGEKDFIVLEKIINCCELFPGQKYKLEYIDKYRDMLNLYIKNYAELLQLNYAEEKKTFESKVIVGLQHNNKIAVDLYQAVQKYFSICCRAKLEDKAVEAYGYLAKLREYDLRNKVNLGRFFRTIEKYDLAIDVFEQLKYQAQADKVIVLEAKTQLWQLYRKVGEYEKCEKIVKNSLLAEQLEFFLAHFNFHLDLDPRLRVSIYRILEQSIAKFKNIFEADNIEENPFIPASHFAKLAKIERVQDVYQERRSTLGLIHFNEENPDVEKLIQIFELGLTTYEQYHTILHELGHNVFINLKNHQNVKFKKLADKFIYLAKKYNLTELYLLELDPVNEAFADTYASWLLFPEILERIKDFSLRNKELYVFFTELFALTAQEVIKIQTIKENIAAAKVEVNAVNNDIELILAEMEQARKKKQRFQRSA